MSLYKMIYFITHIAVNVVLMYGKKPFLNIESILIALIGMAILNRDQWKILPLNNKVSLHKKNFPLIECYRDNQ